MFIKPYEFENPLLYYTVLILDAHLTPVHLPLLPPGAEVLRRQRHALPLGGETLLAVRVLDDGQPRQVDLVRGDAALLLLVVVAPAWEEIANYVNDRNPEKNVFTSFILLPKFFYKSFFSNRLL